jgi:hypothetical protein
MPPVLSVISILIISIVVVSLERKGWVYKSKATDTTPLYAQPNLQA